MQHAIESVLRDRRHEPQGLRRMLAISFGVHAAVVLAALLVPPAWYAREREAPILMTINLGGSPGERSGGLTTVGSRPVEQVAPPEKRPAPVLPAASKKPDPVAAVRTPVKSPPRPADPSPAPPAALTRPPATGTQTTPGTTPAATGATGQGTGLTFGGGGSGPQITLDSQFCCPEYIGELLRRIRERWKSVQPEAGTTVVVFEIRRDGSFTRPEIEQSSGSPMLDIASRAAFVDLRLPPLPAQYQGDSLKIHLSFTYSR